MFRLTKKQKAIGSRLEILSRDLAGRLRDAPAQKQRRAGLAACEYAISHAAIDLPLIREALACLREHGTLARDLVAKVDALAVKVDDEYFALKEAAESGKAAPEDWKRCFARARAIASVSFAGKRDPYMASAEAIYEASLTATDTNDFLSHVEAVLD